MAVSQRSRRHRLLNAALAAAPLLAGGIEFAHGINITLSYDNANSLEPSYDPTGAQLTLLMNQVVSEFEDIFQDAHNVTVTYRWGDIGGFLGLHTLLSQSGGRENSMLVQLSSFNGATQRNWYMDPTPADDSEYAMGQQLWRDLTATQRTNFYNFGANPPATFEAAYHGFALGSAPAAAQNFNDALTVLYQEVGHGLGMSAANISTQTETGDSDYDFDSINIGGFTLAADIDDGNDIAHLVNPNTSMNGDSLSVGQRRKLSHSDLLAMAAVHNYDSLDIPRREFYGGTNWNTASQWTGNAVPGSFDEAYVRASGPNGEIRTANLSANGFVGTLHVHEGGNVDTETFSLSVVDLLDLDGLDTDMFVRTGGTLSMAGAQININNEAELSMTGGVISSVGTIGNNAEIIGNGTINFSGRLNNNGSINVSGGTLLINATGTGSINLDGSGSGTILLNEPGSVFVTAANSDLVINGSLTDAFNGDITVGNSNSLTMNDAWVLGGSTGTIILSPDGVLNLNGGTTSATAAVLNGAIVTVNGDVNVGTNSFGIINAASLFIGGEIHVQSGGTLRLVGNTSFNGGTYDGAGSIQFDGNTTISGDTTFNIANFDFDGGLIVDTFTISNDVTMTVNGDVTDDYDDNLNILGSLIVNGPSWGLNTGSITLSTGTIGGTAGFRNNSQGSLTVNSGQSAIATTSNFGGTATNVINGTLRLQGNAVISGGNWTGTGSLSLDDQITTFTGNTTLGMNGFDMDGLINGNGTVNINSGVQVTVTGEITDTFNATLNVNSGSLTVNGGPWNSSGVVNLNGTTAGVAAAITGQPFTNNAAGVINISGGTNSPGIVSGDDGEIGGPEGGTGGGRIATGTFVNAGDINVATNSFGVIVGNITFNSASNVVINTGGELSLQGPTTYNGGSYTGPGILTQNTGAMTVAANTTIDVATYDWDGGDVGPFSTTTVNPGVTFTINSNVIDDDGVNDPYESTATVNSGSLIVNTSSTWRLAGTLNLTDTGGGDSFLGGQAVQLVTGGSIVTTAGASSGAAVLFENGNINVVSSGFTITGSFRGLASGSLTKSGPGLLTINGPQGHSANTSLLIDNGNVTMNTDAGAGGANLSIAHSGTALTMSTSQHLARLSIDTGATAAINAGGNDNVLRVVQLDITGGAAPTGTLNLVDENLIVDYTGATPLIDIRNWLLSGYNGNTWTGDGIRSSFAAADPNNRALGYAEATSIGSPATFAGEAIDTTTVVVTLTLPGDVNLNRIVNLDDFAIVAANFNTPQFWSGGDFDYNFFTDLGDFALLAAHFNQFIPADLPRGGTVPEPAGAMALTAAAAAMSRRRRR